VNEKEANHPAHPMDRTANWWSHGGWFTLGQASKEGLENQMGGAQNVVCQLPATCKAMKVLRLVSVSKMDESNYNYMGTL
jgi:hypothetical protein